MVRDINRFTAGFQDELNDQRRRQGQPPIQPELARMMAALLASAAQQDEARPAAPRRGAKAAPSRSQTAAAIRRNRQDEPVPSPEPMPEARRTDEVVPVWERQADPSNRAFVAPATMPTTATVVTPRSPDRTRPQPTSTPPAVPTHERDISRENPAVVAPAVMPTRSLGSQMVPVPTERVVLSPQTGEAEPAPQAAAPAEVAPAATSTAPPSAPLPPPLLPEPPSGTTDEAAWAHTEAERMRAEAERVRAEAERIRPDVPPPMRPQEYWDEINRADEIERRADQLEDTYGYRTPEEIQLEQQQRQEQEQQQAWDDFMNTPIESGPYQGQTMGEISEQIDFAGNMDDQHRQGRPAGAPQQPDEIDIAGIFGFDPSAPPADFTAEQWAYLVGPTMAPPEGTGLTNEQWAYLVFTSRYLDLMGIDRLSEPEGLGKAAIWAMRALNYPLDETKEQMGENAYRRATGQEPADFTVDLSGWGGFVSDVAALPGNTQSFDQWSKENPDLVIQLYENGYNGYSGGRAVWEYYIGQQPQWYRFGFDVVADPLNATMLLSGAGGVIARTGTTLTRGASRTGRILGRTAQVAGRTMQIPDVALSIPGYAITVPLEAGVRAGARRGRNFLVERGIIPEVTYSQAERLGQELSHAGARYEWGEGVTPLTLTRPPTEETIEDVGRWVAVDDPDTGYRFQLADRATTTGGADVTDIVREAVAGSPTASPTGGHRVEVIPATRRGDSLIVYDDGYVARRNRSGTWLWMSPRESLQYISSSTPLSPNVDLDQIASSPEYDVVGDFPASSPYGARLLRVEPKVGTGTSVAVYADGTQITRTSDMRYTVSGGPEAGSVRIIAHEPSGAITYRREIHAQDPNDPLFLSETGRSSRAETMYQIGMPDSPIFMARQEHSPGAETTIFELVQNPNAGLPGEPPAIRAVLASGARMPIKDAHSLAVEAWNRYLRSQTRVTPPPARTEAEYVRRLPGTTPVPPAAVPTPPEAATVPTPPAAATVSTPPATAVPTPPTAAATPTPPEAATAPTPSSTAEPAVSNVTGVPTIRVVERQLTPDDLPYQINGDIGSAPYPRSPVRTDIRQYRTFPDVGMDGGPTDPFRDAPNSARGRIASVLRARDFSATNQVRKNLYDMDRLTATYASKFANRDNFVPFMKQEIGRQTPLSERFAPALESYVRLIDEYVLRHGGPLNQETAAGRAALEEAIEKADRARLRILAEAPPEVIRYMVREPLIERIPLDQMDRRFMDSVSRALESDRRIIEQRIGTSIDERVRTALEAAQLEGVPRPPETMVPPAPEPTMPEIPEAAPVLPEQPATVPPLAQAVPPEVPALPPTAPQAAPTPPAQAAPPVPEQIPTAATPPVPPAAPPVSPAAPPAAPQTAPPPAAPPPAPAQGAALGRIQPNQRIVRLNQPPILPPEGELTVPTANLLGPDQRPTRPTLSSADRAEQRIQEEVERIAQRRASGAPITPTDSSTERLAQLLTGPDRQAREESLAQRVQASLRQRPAVPPPPAPPNRGGIVEPIRDIVRRWLDGGESAPLGPSSLDEDLINNPDLVDDSLVPDRYTPLAASDVAILNRKFERAKDVVGKTGREVYQQVRTEVNELRMLEQADRLRPGQLPAKDKSRLKALRKVYGELDWSKIPDDPARMVPIVQDLITNRLVDLSIEEAGLAVDRFARQPGAWNAVKWGWRNVIRWTNINIASSIVDLPRRLMGDTIGDSLNLAINGEWDPIIKQFRYVNDAHRALSAESLMDTPLAHTYREYGLTIPQGSYPYVLRSNDRALMRELQRVGGQRQIQGSWWTRANRFARDWINGFDSARRMAVADQVWSEDAPRLAEAVLSNTTRAGERYGITFTSDEWAQFLREAVGLGQHGFSAQDLYNTLRAKALTQSGVSGAQAHRFAKAVADAHADAIMATHRKSIERVNRSLFSYEYNALDEALTNVFSFHYYQSRALPMYVRQGLHHPALLANYLRLNEELRQKAEGEGWPSSLVGFLQVMAGPMGWMLFFNPTSFFDVFNYAKLVAEGEGNLNWFERLLNFPLIPGLNVPLSLMVNLAGFTPNTPVPNPFGLGQEADLTFAAINAINAAIGGDEVIRDPLEQGLSRVRERTSGMAESLGVPGSQTVRSEDTAAYQESQVRQMVVTIAEEEYGKPWSEFTEEERDAVRGAQWNPDHPWRREAYRRWSAMNLGTEAVQTVSPFRFVGRPEVDVDLRAASQSEGPYSVRATEPVNVIPAIREQEQLREAAWDIRETTEAGEQDVATLRDLADDYQQLTADNQAIQVWNYIAYGDIQQNVTVQGRTYTPARMAQLTEAERRVIATAFINENGLTEEYEAGRAAQDQFRNEHPAYAAYSDWANRVGKFTGESGEGVNAYWREEIKVNPNARAYYEDQIAYYGSEEAIPEWELTSVDAYLAIQGAQLSRFDAEPEATSDPTQIVSDVSMQGGGTGGGFEENKPWWELSPEEQVQSLIEDMWDYDERMQSLALVINEWQGGGPYVPMDRMSPMMRRALEMRLNAMGITIHEPSAQLRQYAQWRANDIAQGGDGDIMRFVMWRQAQQERRRAGIDALAMQFGYTGTGQALPPESATAPVEWTTTTTP